MNESLIEIAVKFFVFLLGILTGHLLFIFGQKAYTWINYIKFWYGRERNKP